MFLERAFRRLAIAQSSPICRQCQRTFALSAQTRAEQRSATASFMDSLQTSRDQDRRPVSTPTATATRPAAPESAPSTPPAASSTTGNNSQYLAARRAIIEATSRDKERRNRQALSDLQRSYSRKDLEQQATRRWKQGDVYAPHDLTGVEMAKWKKQRKKPKPKFDVLDQLAINPLQHYKNFSMMSEYVTEMGRIRHSNDTGLRPVNQRKMAKAIRRAMGTGLLMPGVHRHPELLRMQQEQSRPRY